MIPMITQRFINGVIRDGRLTEARRRHEGGTAKPSGRDFNSQSCWGLICEEVIDTDHDPEEYDAVYSELIRRGFDCDEIDEMRRLAWRSAGWLNYDMMLWDWVSLNEDDIRTAIEMRYGKWKFRRKRRMQDLEVVQSFLDRDPVSPDKNVAEQVEASDS